MFSKTFYIISLFSLILIAIACKPSASSEEVKTEPIKKENFEEKPRISYSVSLGVMPDTNYKGEGMSIGKVSEEKAGHKAGLLKGDIVKEMDGDVVSDLYSYTKALSKYKKGSIAKVLIERGEKTMEVLVEF